MGIGRNKREVVYFDSNVVNKQKTRMYTVK